MSDSQYEIFASCIRKQLDEIDLLWSIYSTPGEIHLFDPGVISDFNEYLSQPNLSPLDTSLVLKAHLDYTITLAMPNAYGQLKEKLEVRIELPHLYPLLENAIVTVRSSLLTKTDERYLRVEVEKYVAGLEKNECYVYQVVSWIQDRVDDIVKSNPKPIPSSPPVNSNIDPDLVEFERLWIYSHHLKSKTKRQEILRTSENMDLSGFSRPGKPGIICVEGLRENTQEFWRYIKTMRWQKITICKSEVAQIPQSKVGRIRRFVGCKEMFFCEDPDDDEGRMDMSKFFKFLETHNSGYMKKELFGIH